MKTAHAYSAGEETTTSRLGKVLIPFSFLCGRTCQAVGIKSCKKDATTLFPSLPAKHSCLNLVLELVAVWPITSLGFFFLIND